MAFKVHIRSEAYDKIMHWINKSSNEVGGFGKVIYNEKEKIFEIVESYLVEQEVGSASTDITANGLGKLMFETKDHEGELNWWWHSHVNMNVFWSTTDMDTIKTYGKQGWQVATVFNKKEEMRSAVAFKLTNERFGEMVQVTDELETSIIYPYSLTQELIKELDKEYETKVKSRSYSASNYNTSNYATNKGGGSTSNASNGSTATGKYNKPSFNTAKWTADNWRAYFEDGVIPTGAVANVASGATTGDRVQPSLFNDDTKQSDDRVADADGNKYTQDEIKWGLLGYGSAKESLSLKVPRKDFEAALRNDDKTLLAKWEGELLTLEEAGYFGASTKEGH